MKFQLAPIVALKNTSLSSSAYEVPAPVKNALGVKNLDGEDPTVQISNRKYALLKKYKRMALPSIQLTPDLKLVGQISKSGMQTYITFSDQRPFLLIEDAQGRRLYFYQSFSGTSGKTQGWWYPSGGALGSCPSPQVSAQHNMLSDCMKTGKNAEIQWIIKVSPASDPYLGRSNIKRMYESLNSVLPHSDADTSAFIKELTGYEFGNIEYKDAFALPVTIRVEGWPHGDPTKQDELRTDALQIWRDYGYNETFGPRGS